MSIFGHFGRNLFSSPREFPQFNKDLRVVHIGGYWRGQNDVVRQMMLGLKQTGANVIEICTDDHPELLEPEVKPYDRGTSGPNWIARDLLMRMLADFRPHLFICNAGGLGFREQDAREIRKHSYLLGVALSDPDVFAPATSKISLFFDIFFTNAAACLPDYSKIGAPAFPLHFGTFEGFYRPVPPKPEYACDVLIFGRGQPQRVPPVRQLVSLFNTHVYGELWDQHGIPSRGLVFGEESLSVLSSARLTIVFGNTTQGNFIVKPYLFDYPAAGATVITERVKEVENYFTYGKEVIGFSGTDELVEKVRYYLAHPDEAEAIRAAGHARVLKEYTWKQRWSEMLSLLRSHAR